MSTTTSTKPTTNTSRKAAAKRNHDGDDEKAIIMASRYKCKPCQNFEAKGSCPYEVRCMFAHGPGELRTKEQNLEEGITTEEAIKDHRRKVEPHGKRQGGTSSSGAYSSKRGLNSGSRNNKKGGASTPSNNTITPTKGPTLLHLHVPLPEPSASATSAGVHSLCEILPIRSNNHGGSHTPNTCSMGSSLNGLDLLGGSTNLGSFGSLPGASYTGISSLESCLHPTEQPRHRHTPCDSGLEPSPDHYAAAADTNAATSTAYPEQGAEGWENANSTTSLSSTFSGGGATTIHPTPASYSATTAFRPTLRLMKRMELYMSPAFTPEAPHIRKLTAQELAQGFYINTPYAHWQYNAECECQECVATLV